MKILVIHTRYHERSGEDRLVDMEVELLKGAHEVEVLFFENKPGLKGLLQFLCSIWNIRAARIVKKKIKTFQPDLVHIHNWHFATGPIVFHTVANAGVRLVATLHNYRILCPSATLSHDGSVWLKSLTQDFPWTTVRHKVYRNSYLLTYWLAMILYVHRKIGTWNKAAKFLIPSESMAPIFKKAGWNFPVHRLEVKANFTTQPALKQDGDKKGFLYIGRLSPEKGIDILLDAFEKTGLPLKIVGAGPMETTVIKTAEKNPNIKYLGLLNREAVVTELAGAAALVFTSTWHEPFGMVIIEAFSVGTPVIASSIGAPATLVEHEFNGFQYNCTSAAFLSEALLRWDRLSDEAKDLMRKNAFFTYVTKYSPQKNLEILNEKYQSCL